LLGIYSILQFWKEGLLKYVSFSYLKDAFNIGYPLTLHRLGLWGANMGNRIIINDTLGKKATASFGIASTFNMIITFINDSFNNAYVPFLFEELSKRIPNKEKLVKITYYYYAGINILALIFSIVGYLTVGAIFGDEYSEVAPYIYPLVFAGAFNGMYKMHINYLFFTKNTFDITKVTLFSGILNLIICYIFVKKFGISGAAWSMLITQMLTYIGAFYFSNKKYRLPWISYLKKIA